MIEKTEAIVLNKIKYSDSSVIVNFLSRDIGRFTAIIRTPKNPKNGIKRSLLFPLSIVETEVKFKDTRTIQSVLYCNRKENIDGILCDINKLAIAQFIAEVTLKTIKEEEPNTKVYDYLKETIVNLNSSNANLNGTHIFFLRDLATLSGFGMHPNYCDGSPFFNLREGMFLPVFTSSEESLDKHESQILAKLLNSDNKEEILGINYAMRKKLLEQMLNYYKLHIPGFVGINSLKVLQEVFAG